MEIDFELFGEITDAETMAIGPSIRELPQLRVRFGHGRRRKRKGVANVRLRDSTIRLAEILGQDRARARAGCGGVGRALRIHGDRAAHKRSGKRGFCAIPGFSWGP